MLEEKKHEYLRLYTFIFLSLKLYLLLICVVTFHLRYYQRDCNDVYVVALFLYTFPSSINTRVIEEVFIKSTPAGNSGYFYMTHKPNQYLVHPGYQTCSPHEFRYTTQAILVRIPKSNATQ